MNLDEPNWRIEGKRQITEISCEKGTLTANIYSLNGDWRWGMTTGVESRRQYALSGGTRMYCPNCEALPCCEAISISKTSKGKRDQRWLYYDLKNRDIQWVRRGRMCRYCLYIFVTAELPEEFIDELAQLRAEIATARSEQSLFDLLSVLHSDRAATQ